MRWVLFVVGLLIGLVGGAGGMLYLVMQNKAAAETDEIVLAPKAFLDNDASVSASGTMTGDGLAYPNNSYSIGCYRDHKECWITGFEQIGPKQIGRMDAPYSYDIVKWTPYEVVAGDDGGIGCFKTVGQDDSLADQLFLGSMQFAKDVGSRLSLIPGFILARVQQVVLIGEAATRQVAAARAY
jgi:hypothetical protein